MPTTGPIFHINYPQGRLKVQLAPHIPSCYTPKEHETSFRVTFLSGARSVQRISHDDVEFYRFKGLDEEPGLDHALFTRRGGVSRPPYDTLNVGHTVGDDLAAVRVNHQRALAALGWRQPDVASAHQVHGARVGVVGLADKGRVRPETDALVTVDADVVLMLRFADCVPVLFFDRRRRAVGLAHAGWRGVAVGVVLATVARLVETFGCRPADLWAGVGPSIGPCCYEVGQEVVQPISAAVNGGDPFRQQDGRLHLDLWAAVQNQLEEAGVGQVEVAELCTACRTDEWFSHRAERGRTGRFGVVLGLKA
jgi:YfiH family protein